MVKNARLLEAREPAGIFELSPPKPINRTPVVSGFLVHTHYIQCTGVRKTRRSEMSTVTVGQENSAPIEIYYEDHGSGKPVVLVHRWALSGASGEKQVTDLLRAAHRVITSDRRGFGQSSKPSTGYDYDTFTEDLHKLVTQLDLRDFALVGFSMGGGEVARYFGKYGSEGVSTAVCMAAVTLCLLKTADNPPGDDAGAFERMEAGTAAEAPAVFDAFAVAPHGRNWTHASKLNPELAHFLA